MSDMDKLINEQDRKIKDALDKGIGQFIEDVEASEFSIDYHTSSNSNCLCVRGYKRKTSHMSLDKNLLKFIDHRFSIYVYKNRFNFYPGDQKKLLFDNEEAINRKKLSDAKDLIDSAVLQRVNDIVDGLRKLTDVTLDYNDFNFNVSSNKFEAEYDLRRNLNPEICHVKIEFSEISHICERLTRAKSGIFSIAKSVFDGYEKDLSFEDVFPGASPIFRVSISPSVYSLINREDSYKARLRYDEKDKQLKHSNRNQSIKEADAKYAISFGENIVRAGLFQNSRDKILKIIQNASNSRLRRVFQYAYILAFHPQELEESVIHLNCYLKINPSLPNPLSIHKDANTIDWVWLCQNFDEVCDGVVISFNRYSNDIFDSWSSESSNSSYIIPVQTNDPERLNVYLFTLSDSVSNFVFNVAKDDVEIVMFFLWAVFGSSYALDNHITNMFSQFFDTLNIGTIKNAFPLKYENGEYRAFLY